ncbi:hypothetical protein [Sinomicrobium sp. M5D2P9]
MKKDGKLRKILILFLILTSCKANKVEVKNVEQVPSDLQCPLRGLLKTTNYKNEIEELSKDYKRKIMEIESLELDSAKYRTVLHLKASSQHLWLIKNNLMENSADSILVHCIDSTRSVEAEFDIDNCEIEIMETEFFSNGDPKVSISKIIKL